jgi:hypothetical protein
VSSIKNVAESDTNPMVASDTINNQNHDEQVSAEQQTLSELIESEGAKRPASVFTQKIDAIRSSSAPPTHEIKHYRTFYSL